MSHLHATPPEEHGGRGAAELRKVLRHVAACIKNTCHIPCPASCVSACKLLCQQHQRLPWQLLLAFTTKAAAGALC